jgi:signal transduction histidine kinase
MFNEKEEKVRSHWITLTSILPFIIASFLYFQEGIFFNEVIFGFVLSSLVSFLLVVFMHKKQMTFFLTILLFSLVPAFAFESIKLYKELLLEQNPHGIIQTILFGWWMLLSYKMTKMNVLCISSPLRP